jgi:redox-sensing transcriptional repressor
MNLPKPTAERLSRLAHLLERLPPAKKHLSSADLERLTGWPSHTIRKDISALPATDGVSTQAGYDPARLSEAIRAGLGFETERQHCCIVGLGRLGSAFLESSVFAGSHFTPLAGFDSNVNRIEILKADFPLYPAYKMKEIIPRMEISYAILCVPTEQAAQTAERLVDCGIRGIVNCTPVLFPVPDGIEVEQVSIVDALGTLAARLATNKRREE